MLSVARARTNMTSASTAHRVLALALRVVLLFAVYAVLLIATSGLAVPREAAEQQTSEQAREALLALPVVALSSTAVLAYLVLRSRLAGPKLACMIGIAFYAVHTLLQQVEALAFPAVADRMPAGMIPRLLVSGALFAALIAPASVFLLGKWKPEPDQQRGALESGSFRSHWVLRLSSSVVLYEIIYFGFGYFIAWRTPGLPEFYHGHDPGSLFGQLANVIADSPWLPILQAARGACWTLIAVVLMRTSRAGMWEASLAIGLFFSVTVAVQLSFPNPYMPDYVVRAHQRELMVSNFTFGVLVSVLWAWQGRHWREFVRRVQYLWTVI